MNNNTVLITGASSGIGYEFSKIYAKNNYNLVIVARSLEKLENLKNKLEKENNVSVEVIEMDLSEKNAAIELYNIVKNKNITINTLINNAGFGIYGEFSTFSKNDIIKNEKMTQLNINFLVELTKLYLDDFLLLGKGELLNVASIAGFFPGPYMANYYASKSYVLSFTEAIRSEINNRNIKISTLCPGPTETNFEKASKLDNGHLFNSMKVMSAEKVVKIAYKDFNRGKSIIIPGFTNKLIVFISRFISRNLLLKITKKIMKSK